MRSHKIFRKVLDFQGLFFIQKEPAGARDVHAMRTVMTLRISFPQAELDFMESAVRRFNESHGYLDNIVIKPFKNRYALLICAAESAMFAESYLAGLSRFSKERIKADLIKEIEGLLKIAPNNLPAVHSLNVLRDLSF